MITGYEYKYIKKLESLDLDFSMLPQAFGYDNPNLICLDVVLSMNRQYNTFVIPRLNFFKTNFPEIQTLQDLKNLITRVGIYSFESVWNYKHPQRVIILRDLISFFLENKKQINISEDLSSMIYWAKNADITNQELLPVKGIGFVTTQYIRKMLGVDTVKPDIHIKRSVELWLGEKMSYKQIVLFIEDVAKKLGLTPTQLDHAIWKYFSVKPSN